jgi:hypothetical protein
LRGLGCRRVPRSGSGSGLASLAGHCRRVPSGVVRNARGFEVWVARTLCCWALADAGGKR